MNLNPNQHRDTRRDYHDQLKQPEWIALRNRLIRERGCCESCGATDYPYEVHHRGYLPNRLAWEYDDSNFSVFCENCHEDITEDADKIWNMILSLDPNYSRLAVKLVAAIVSDQDTLMKAYRTTLSF